MISKILLTILIDIILSMKNQNNIFNSQQISEKKLANFFNALVIRLYLLIDCDEFDPYKSTDHYKSWPPHRDPFDSDLEDYFNGFDEISRSFHLIFHEYLFLIYPDQSDCMRAVYFMMFNELLNKEDIDLVELASLHPSKPNTNNLIKHIKKNKFTFQGAPKNVQQELIDDYIAMMKEARLPIIDEEKIHHMVTKGSSISQFWHIYGAMAFLLSRKDTEYFSEQISFSCALDRYKKVTNDEDKVFNLLSYLCDEFANDKNWLKYNISERYTDLDNAMYDRGYSGITYAESLMNSNNSYNNYDYFDSFVYSTPKNKTRREDLRQFIDSRFKYKNNISNYIKEKYYDL